VRLLAGPPRSLVIVMVTNVTNFADTSSTHSIASILAKTSMAGGDEPPSLASDSDGPPRIASGDKTRTPSEPVQFLEWLRPGGPWVLTAINPNIPGTKTITAMTAQAVDDFVRRYNGKWSIYYGVNPTRKLMDKKAAKIDIAQIEYALADLDPKDDETPEEAKTRYLEQFNGAFEPKPTAIVDSGNGIQCLWRWQDPIKLGNPIKGPDGRMVFLPEDQAKIADVEKRIEQIMLRLGSKAGTQNIDRILRLPGTTNVPNKRKRELGRVECPTRLIEFSSKSYGLDAFPKSPAAQSNAESSQAEAGSDGEDARSDRAHASNDDQAETGSDQEDIHSERTDTSNDGDDLDDLIRNGCGQRFGGDRSRAVWRVVNEMLRLGWLPPAVTATLLNKHNGISAHIYDQADPPGYAEKQVLKALHELDFIRSESGRPLSNQVNIRIALFKMGVAVRYDSFADRMVIDGLRDFGPVLDDAAMTRLRLTIGQRYHFLVTKGTFYDVVTDAARRNAFHPVCEYLAGLTWDGVKRVDTWLIKYAGAEDNQYTRAVGALLLVAAVRRVRKPGCKFDELPVLESPQGHDKSTGLRTMAVRDDWFTDDLPLNVDGKKVIETLRGKWIVEAAELSGMRRADIERVKALLSRQADRARLSYDRITSEVQRQCVMIGTTNDIQYLKDTTGNRRFWPVRIERFDVEALKQDRDQLWAEAAAREARGESIRLQRELWPKAAQEQDQRLARDPFLDALEDALSGREGKIKASDVWLVLDKKPGHATQDDNVRLGKAMRALGWSRPPSSTARFGGKPVSAYVKGEKRIKDGSGQPEWAEITVSRSPQEGLQVLGGELKDSPI
jgi:hypothetical protein